MGGCTRWRKGGCNLGLKDHSQTYATLPTLAGAARWKMDKDTDLAWLDQVHTVMGVLRAVGVLPVTRCSINGHLHSLFSAMLVEAHVWAGDTVYVHTRKLSTLATQGISTHMLGWLTIWFRRVFCTVHNKAEPMVKSGCQVGC